MRCAVRRNSRTACWSSRRIGVASSRLRDFVELVSVLWHARYSCHSMRVQYQDHERSIRHAFPLACQLVFGCRLEPEARIGFWMSDHDDERTATAPKHVQTSPY